MVSASLHNRVQDPDPLGWNGLANHQKALAPQRLGGEAPLRRLMLKDSAVKDQWGQGLLEGATLQHPVGDWRTQGQGGERRQVRGRDQAS
jgi:hypothetical protein